MTPEQATAKLQELYKTLGLPQHAPFVGNVWDKATAGFIQAYKKNGDIPFAQMFNDALAAIRVLGK